MASNKGLKRVLGAAWLDSRFRKEFVVSLIKHFIVDSFLYGARIMNCT